MDKTNKQYIKGFNEGYILKQFEPELAEKLLNIENTSERMDGLINGIDQYDREHSKAPYPSWMNDRESSQHSKDHESKDDINLERD